MTAPEFGPFVRYSDPRVYGLVADYRWGDFQRALLLGHQSWSSEAMGHYQAKACRSLVRCLDERGIVIANAPGHQGDVVTISIDLPPDDAMLPALLDQHGLGFKRVRVVAFDGLIETVDGVPILKAAVFAKVEDADGEKRPGLHREAWIVGRLDVGTFTEGDHVRGTFRRALNTARRVAAAVPDWERAVAAEAAREKERAATRVVVDAIALEEEDDSVAGVLL